MTLDSWMLHTKHEERWPLLFAICNSVHQSAYFRTIIRAREQGYQPGVQALFYVNIFSRVWHHIYQNNWKEPQRIRYISLPANLTLILWCSQGLLGSHEIIGMCWTSSFEIFRPLGLCHCMKNESEKGIDSVKKAAFHTLVTSVYCHYSDKIVVQY